MDYHINNINHTEGLYYLYDGIILVNDLNKLSLNLDNFSISNLHPEMAILIFVRKGSISLSIDNMLCEVKERHLLLCRPGRRLELITTSADFIGHAILLTVRFSQSILKVAGNIWNYIMQIDNQPVISIPKHTWKLLRSYYTLIISETRRKENIYYTEVISSLIRSMLCSLINDLRHSVIVDSNSVRTDVKSSSMESSQAMKLFNRLMDILTNEHCTQRNLSHYAERLCVSTKYLSTVCKKVSNRSAHDWIREAVVNEINNYLKFSDKSVKEIAMHFDFPNLAFFSRYVKQNLGATPTQITSTR